MMRGNRSALGLAVALAFAFVPSVALSAGVSSAAAATCGSLSRQTVTQARSSEFRDVAFLSAGESWAVGDRLAATGDNQTLIERFNGSGWSIVPSPNQTTKSNGLNGVSMTAGAGWAVGYALHPGWTYQPLALHWNGTQWSLASPAPLAGHAYFTGVHALADGSAWAVGFQTAGGARRTLIEHASGTAWTKVASPNDGTASTSNMLMAVSGTAAAGFWAVGYQQSRTGAKPLVLRYDTALPSPSWVSVSGAGGVPSPGAVETVLTGVDVRTASDVWAVGYYDMGSVKRPLALHWDGSTWSNSPISGGTGMLRDVNAIAAGNVWAAGTYYDSSGHRTKTLVVHFGGTAWTTVVSADSPGGSGELIGMTANPAGSAITVVGRQGGGPLAEQANCPSGPVSLPTRTAAPAPPAPAAPGIGPAPTPPPPTPPPTAPVTVTVTDQAPAAGLAAPDLTWSAATADFNSDGWPDIFVAQHFHVGHLWVNDHDGTFSQIDAGYFKSSDRHDCLAADFNSDGLEDIYCTLGSDRGTALKEDQLYIQQPGNTFTEQAYQWYVANPAGRGRYATILDVNNDGYPDIFSGTAALRSDGLPTPNRLYLNTGHGSFIDSPAMGLDLSVGSRCAHAVDYNSDGWPDLLVCGDVGGLHLYKNNRGHGFTDVSSILGAGVSAGDATMVDVNHDSRPDLITLTTSTLAERLQRADGTFAPPTTILKVQAGTFMAVGDVNGDHNPDIYAVGGRAGNSNAPDHLLLGNASGAFTTKPIPQTTVGQGDRVYAFDYNRDGLTDLLVLNGGGGAANIPGPLQLITPHRA